MLPETWSAWVGVAAVAYLWMGVGRVAQDFNERPISRPGYARSGGPHVILNIAYLPVASLLFYTIGGPGRVLKTLVAAVVHFGLTLLAFWLLGFVLASEWIRLAIIGGLLLLTAIPFLLPVRNTR